MLDLGFERWADGKTCVLGWVILGTRVRGIETENLLGNRKSFNMTDEWVWREKKKEGADHGDLVHQARHCLHYLLSLEHSWQEYSMYAWVEVDFRKVGNRSGGVHVRSVAFGVSETYGEPYKKGLVAKTVRAVSMREARGVGSCFSAQVLMSSTVLGRKEFFCFLGNTGPHYLLLWRSGDSPLSRDIQGQSSRHS